MGKLGIYENKKIVLMRKRLLITMLLTIINIGLAWSYDGEEFVADIPGGKMKFGVISEELKTCRVATSQLYYIEKSDLPADGVVNIPEYVNGYTVVEIASSAYQHGGEDYLTSITLPNTITTIGNDAFSGCAKLVTVRLSEKLAKIDDRVFYGCTSLENIELPEGLVSIGQMPFYCTALETITLPASITSIGGSAFSGCNNLKRVVSKIKTPFAISAFSYGTNTVIIVPKGTKADYKSVSGWKDMVIFEEGETVYDKKQTDEQGIIYTLYQTDNDYSCGYYVTGHTDALPAEITIPSSVSGCKVIGLVGYDVFRDCTNLTKVTFSDGLSYIPFPAFRGCIALMEFVSLIKDPSKVSVECTEEEIYKRAHLIVPKGTKAAYMSTNGWKNFFIFEDGETVVNYERNPADEQGVQYTLRQNEVGFYYAVTGNNGALAERVTLPEKLNGLYVTTITDYSFEDCTGMKWISIPECITDIKRSAFSGCSLTLALNQPLVSGWISCNFITEIELGSKVDSLGYVVFRDCKNLTKVTCSEGLRAIGPEAFRGCSSLKELTLPKSLVTLNNEAFQGCTGLTSVKFEEGVTSIGNSAFSGCTALSNVTLPESLVTLGESVFSGCTSIEEITIPKNVTMVDRYSNYSPFYGCTGLKSVTVHAQRFGNWFREMTSIKEVYVGSEVKVISFPTDESWRGTDGILYGCTGIEIIEVDAANPIFDSRDSCNAIIETATNTLRMGCKTTVIPQTTTSIGHCAFSGCTDLKEINIPAQVTDIGVCAFRECIALKEINIPAQVTSIGSSAFYGCTGLQTITSYLKKPFRISAFSSETLSSATLRIPFGRTKAYKATNGWEFQTIEEMEGVGDEISFIQFADAATKQACVKKWDENGDGEISLEEAKMVTTIDGSYISGSTEITTFDELKYFTNVATIGSSAFSGCKALTSITIPNSVTSIGGNAFYNCVSLATIVLPDSLTSIEAGTFYGCRGLTSITIPDSVTSIGDKAFYECTNLSEINLPEGLLTIGEKAFYGSGLLEMTLPSTLTSIGNYSLAGNVIHCLLTTPISVGTLMYNASDVVLYVPQGCEQAFSQAAGWKNFFIVGAGSNEPTDWTTGVVTVKVEEPGGLRLAVVELDNEEISRLKIIGQLNSSDLQYLAEGNGKIANLESIDMSEVTLDYDGGCYYSQVASDDQVFGVGYVHKYYLTENERTVISHSVPGLSSTITYYYYSPNLPGVFSGKPYKHIVMPTSVKKAANGVFGGCKNLQSAEFPSGMLSIGTGAFGNCERLQSIDVQGIDTIPDKAFSGCRMLQSVDHMNNVKYIGSYAFSGCKMLPSIDHINNVEYIGKSAFYGCIMLNNIQLSENLTYIGEYAFGGCKTLPTVTLPSSLSSLSEGVFSNCSMLKQVVYSPELMQVDYSSFNNTPWLKSLPAENGIKYMGHIALCYDEAMETATVAPATLDFREGTTYIADRFISSVYYAHVQSITSIKLPTSLIKIGDNAFANTRISSLTLPENLEIIGARAFCNLEQLTKVTLSEKLRLIGEGAFAGCDGLTVVNYNAIKAAGDNLFNNCTSLEKVNVGAKVELLPDGIFANCKSLTVVKFEERNNVTPLVVGNSAFSGCKNLPNIKLPDNTESIGDAAFEGCSSLTTFTVPHGVSVVSGAMLSGCSGLTTVQLHEGVTTIGDAAFNGCSKVAAFSLPEKVDSIGASAFSGCYELKELTIPASVTRLGESFLGDCYQLTRLVTKIREPQALSSIIPMSSTIVQEVYHYYSNWGLYSGIHYDEVTLVVPDGCKQRYKDTDGWKLFKNIETESGNDFTDTNKFYVSENVVVKGRTTRMGINLVNNANDLVAYQVDLIVPLGFRITTNANGQYEIVKGQRYENNSHSITVEKLPDHQYATVNKYRIVCMSTSNARITGNDGLLLNVNLYASENYEEGDYKATLDNIIVSKSDGTICELDYVPFNITVTNTANVLKGDANDDGEIDVADVVQTVNYILGRTPNVFARQNADVNEDGEINVGDLVGIVAIIANTYSDAGGNRAALPVEGGHLSGVLTADAATVRVQNPQDFTAFQMLITLPWETDKEQFELKLRGAGDHVVMTNWLSERQVMVVAYSMGLHSLAAGGNAFLQIVTDNAQRGEWKFEDIVFARANGTTCKFEPLYLSQTTGISDEVVQDGKDERMYDLGGRSVMGNSLKKGLYIKGNKKILVK